MRLASKRPKITKLRPSLRWLNLKLALAFSLLLIHTRLTIGEKRARGKEMKRNGHHSCKVCGRRISLAQPTTRPPAVKRVWVSVLLIAFYLRRFSPRPQAGRPAGPWLISNISDQWLAKGWMRELMMINCAARLQLISSLPPFSIHFPQESPGRRGRLRASITRRTTTKPRIRRLSFIAAQNWPRRRSR